MKELEQSRLEINRIDAEMAKLFEERMHAVEAIAAYKRERGLAVRDPAREAALIAKNRGLIRDPAIESYYVPFLQSTIDLSCAYQTKLMNGMRVTYCGEEGAFAHTAAGRMFPGAELTPFPDFAAAYRAVEEGQYDCAVLPLENSSAGEVGPVTDLLFTGSLYVNRVADLPVEHHLLACEGASPDTVRTVVSHPQALAQCVEYLRSHGLAAEEWSNTALAAKYVREKGDPTLAAIASEETAEHCGLRILERNIHDSRNNTTRFAAFSRVQNRPTAAHSDDEAFLLLFTVRNEAGALAQTLNILGAHGYNMRSLRSRPRKDLAWNYYFYIEAEGNVFTEDGQEMLRELEAVCAKLRLAGAYVTEGAAKEGANR